MDTYKTISNASPETIFRDRKSKFFGYAFPILNEAEVKSIINQLKKQHPSANHFCFAWQLGVEEIRYRTNDDGEPNNSAGKPIYGQIQSFGVTNLLVVVVRIFGGTKLGVGGLINAYKSSAQLALEASTIEERIVEIQLELTFDYPLMNEVMRMVKKLNMNVISQEMAQRCKIRVSIKKSETSSVLSQLKRLHKLKIKVG